MLWRITFLFHQKIPAYILNRSIASHCWGFQIFMELAICCNSSHLNADGAARDGFLLGNPMLMCIVRQLFLQGSYMIINSARICADIVNALCSPRNEDPGWYSYILSVRYRSKLDLNLPPKEAHRSCHISISSIALCHLVPISWNFNFIRSCALLMIVNWLKWFPSWLFLMIFPLVLMSVIGGCGCFILYQIFLLVFPSLYSHRAYGPPPVH